MALLGALPSFYTTVQLRDMFGIVNPQALTKAENLVLLLLKLHRNQERMWLELARVARDVTKVGYKVLFPNHPDGEMGAYHSYKVFKEIIRIQLTFLHLNATTPYSFNWTPASQAAILRLNRIDQLYDQLDDIDEEKVNRTWNKRQCLLVLACLIILGIVATQDVSEEGLIITGALLGSFFCVVESFICCNREVHAPRNIRNQIHEALGNIAPRDVEGVAELLSEPARRSRCQQLCPRLFWKKTKGEEKQERYLPDDVELIQLAVEHNHREGKEGEPSEVKEAHTCPVCFGNDEEKGGLKLYKHQGDGGNTLYTPPIHEACLAEWGFTHPGTTRLVPAAIIITDRGLFEYKILVSFITLTEALATLRAFPPTRLPQTGRAPAPLPPPSDFRVSGDGAIVPLSGEPLTTSGGDDDRDEKRSESKRSNRDHKEEPRIVINIAANPQIG